MTANIDPEYTKFFLPNGIKVVLYQRNEIHSVRVKVIVNTGSLDETKKSNGISHFIEHVVHDGTEKLTTWEAIDEYNNKYSGTTNAYTSIDHTQYYGTYPSQFLSQALSYFSQVVLHPLFKDSDVDKERHIILDELKRGEDEIDFEIYKNIKNNRFKDADTPFSYEIIGEKELLENYSTQDLKDYYENYYTPENMEIYIVGNMDIDQAKKEIEKYFYEEIKDKKFNKKMKQEYVNTFPEYSGFSINARKKLDINQYYLTLTFPTFEFTTASEEDRNTESFVRSMTASSQYFQSVLWKRLREELGIVYGVGAFSYSMISRSIYIIQTSFDKKHLETVLKEVKTGINQIKDNKVTDNVFQARRKRIMDTQLMQLDNPENLMSWIIDYEDELDFHKKGMRLSDYLEYVNALKFDSVIEKSNEIYNWDNVNIGVVSQDDPKIVEEEVAKLWSKK